MMNGKYYHQRHVMMMSLKQKLTFNSDCEVMHGLEALVRELKQQARLAHAWQPSNGPSVENLVHARCSVGHDPISLGSFVSEPSIRRCKTKKNLSWKPTRDTRWYAQIIQSKRTPWR